MSSSHLLSRSAQHLYGRLYIFRRTTNISRLSVWGQEIPGGFGGEVLEGGVWGE